MLAPRRARARSGCRRRWCARAHLLTNAPAARIAKARVPFFLGVAWGWSHTRPPNRPRSRRSRSSPVSQAPARHPDWDLDPVDLNRTGAVEGPGSGGSVGGQDIRIHEVRDVNRHGVRLVDEIGRAHV